MIAITIDDGGSVRRMSTKSLRPEQNDYIRGVLQAVVDEDFGGVATAAAKALGIPQSQASDFLAGKTGAGQKVVFALADYTGRSLDELYGRPRLPSGEGGHELLGARADWAQVREEAVTKARTVQAADIDRVADVGLSHPPEKLTPDFVIRMAEALLYAVPYEKPAPRS